jgi:2-polyprenyl-3-methyl-5-hydroxy-6-metoxy-1,4-benzoquinol methylase
MRAKKTQTGITKQPKDYFKVVYKADKSGEFKQSRFDKMRDGIFVRLFNKYSAKPLKVSAVLDIGCGYGYLLNSFKGAKEIYGTDISKEAVEMAKKQNPSFNVSVADILKPSKINKKFDLILAINVIEHLTNPKIGVKNIKSLLDNNGLVIIHLPTINNELSKWVYSKTYAKDPTHVFRPTGGEVKKLFTNEGFELLQESYMPYWPKFIFKHAKIHPAYLAVFRLSKTAK